MEDENFGVAELAEKVGMSRSNLLRKVQKLTGLSVSVFIRQVRLHRAKALLQDSSFNVSEVSYKVGFNSTSYFIKCFREQYGYPPGEEAKRASELAEEPVAPLAQAVEKKPNGILRPLVALAVLALLVVVFLMARKSRPAELPFEKSIAVLPFKNDSNDSSNVYFINGLMEAVLNNLQKIEDLRVVSRTSVEQYRHQSKSIAEMAEEMDVNYFVEGSGQKVGDQIILTIQLIEARSDRHLWSERYSRQTLDIFSLQAEVAQAIADEIEVIITPEEQRRIEKIPTQSLTAYDYYLKGMELTKVKSFEALERAISYFDKAIAEDEDFAHAYASAAICYYYLDFFQANKVHMDDLKQFADQALLLDAELPESLIAKGLYYLQAYEYELAAEYMQKVLLYNPNSAEAYNFLSSIYNAHMPDTQKYLQYALRGIKLDRTSVDSATTSISYLHLANALAQTGFIKEAEQYIKVSMDYDPTNLFSEYVYAYILLARDKDVPRTLNMLLQTLQKDTTRLDVVQEVAKVYYTMEDYESAYLYYDKFVNAREMFGFDIFITEDIKIGFVMQQVGQQERGARYIESYLQYAEGDESMYKDLSMAAYYAVQGEVEKGIAHLKLFAQQRNYQYWFVLLMEDDPIIHLLSDHPEFTETMAAITARFWEDHNALRSLLEGEGLVESTSLTLR
ncbi:MAG: helix-turn-helix domain-containing protein [Roseivirga sp.]|nr:helix-turn-helix domain-containing protein [Roseivirga sp.]